VADLVVSAVEASAKDRVSRDGDRLAQRHVFVVRNEDRHGTAVPLEERSLTGQLALADDLAHGVARIDAGDGNPPVHGFAQTAIYAQDQMRFGQALRAYAGVRAERDGAQGGAFAPSPLSVTCHQAPSP